MTILTTEHWAKIRENNKNIKDFIDKIEVVGITAAEYEKKFPKLARLINLEEVKKMKLVSQTIKVPANVGKVKKAKSKAIDIIVPGNITPKDIARELKTSAKALRKVIRKLKLVRVGKCWQWNPTDKEINLIKAAYLKSIQPATPKPAKKKAVAVEAVEELEAAEEDEDEVEDEEEDMPDTIKVPPAI